MRISLYHTLRLLGLAVTAIVLLITITACGKKPRFVDPPQGQAADTFPRTYPKPLPSPLPSPEVK